MISLYFREYDASTLDEIEAQIKSLASRKGTKVISQLRNIQIELWRASLDTLRKQTATVTDHETPSPSLNAIVFSSPLRDGHVCGWQQLDVDPVDANELPPFIHAIDIDDDTRMDSAYIPQESLEWQFFGYDPKVSAYPEMYPTVLQNVDITQVLDALPTPLGRGIIRFDITPGDGYVVMTPTIVRTRLIPSVVLVEYKPAEEPEEPAVPISIPCFGDIAFHNCGIDSLNHKFALDADILNEL